MRHSGHSRDHYMSQIPNPSFYEWVIYIQSRKETCPGCFNRLIAEVGLEPRSAGLQ